jgi:hypothetical protein
MKTTLTISKILHRLHKEEFNIEVAWTDDEGLVNYAAFHKQRMITFKQTLLGDLYEGHGIRCLDIMPEGNRRFVGYASIEGRANVCMNDMVRFLRCQ